MGVVFHNAHNLLFLPDNHGYGYAIEINETG